MNILIVAAHPDDDVLGCGGTICRHSDNGDTVHILYMADGVSSRFDYNNDESFTERNEAAYQAASIMGVSKLHFLGFPDNRMDSVPLLEIVQKLEPVIEMVQPEIIYTHHPSDLNVDHQLAHKAVMTACRPQPKFCVREIYCFEVLSSTEWSSAAEKSGYVPNCFVDITNYLERKMEALRCYDVEIREFPHSRSYKSVEALAVLRGATSGVAAAESYYTARILK